jgi:hypothetical protein
MLRKEVDANEIELAKEHEDISIRCEKNCI